MSIARPRSLRGLTASAGYLQPLEYCSYVQYNYVTPVGSTSPLWAALGSPYCSGRDAERCLGTYTLSCP
jgi:hypothetical protein